MASPTRRPLATSFASFVSTTIVSPSTSGLTSSGGRAAFISVKAQAPCAAPSTTTCPRSRAGRPFRASAATAKASWRAPSARARFAATPAARRIELRVISPPFPMPTSRRRSGLTPPGYRSAISSRFPLKSPLLIARVITPPAARSSSASDAGRVFPCASAMARSGVSTWASGALTSLLLISDMLDYALRKSGGRDLRRVGHQSRQVVRHAPRANRALEAAHDRGGHVGPAELLEHHRARENHAAGIHFVLTGILGCGAVGRLEHGEPVPHVASRGETEPAHLRRGRIREQVAVQVRRRDHRVLVGSQHELSEHRVGDAVLDDHPSAVPLPRIGFRNRPLTEPLPCHFISPFPESALGELHDIALVHEGYRLASRAQRILDRLRHQAL